MRFILSFFSYLFIAVAVGVCLLSFLCWRDFNAAGPLHEDKPFVVAKGQGVSQIARNLENQGMISNALVFRVISRISGKDSDLHAGEYMIRARESMSGIMARMGQGDIYYHSLTVPEGLTSWQIVQLLRHKIGGFGVDNADDIEIPPEGALLPETYHYTRGESVEDILARMRKAMSETIGTLWEGRDKNSPILSQAEAIILASIVEKETGVAGERADVAAVFMNRLKIGMPLQTDPTVIYAITKGKIEDNGKGPLGRRLLRKDLQFESPYNTYKNPGLPPGPIANPGRASIMAVLHPAHHDYLYFVADGSGGHVFAKSLEEHNENAAKWRKIRKNQK